MGKHRVSHHLLVGTDLKVTLGTAAGYSSEVLVRGTKNHVRYRRLDTSAGVRWLLDGAANFTGFSTVHPSLGDDLEEVYRRVTEVNEKVSKNLLRDRDVDGLLSVWASKPLREYNVAIQQNDSVTFVSCGFAFRMGSPHAVDRFLTHPISGARLEDLLQTSDPVAPQLSYLLNHEVSCWEYQAYKQYEAYRKGAPDVKCPATTPEQARAFKELYEWQTQFLKPEPPATPATSIVAPTLQPWPPFPTLSHVLRRKATKEDVIDFLRYKAWRGGVAGVSRPAMTAEQEEAFKELYTLQDTHLRQISVARQDAGVKELRQPAVQDTQVGAQSEDPAQGEIPAPTAAFTSIGAPVDTPDRPKSPLGTALLQCIQSCQKALDSITKGGVV